MMVGRFGDENILVWVFPFLFWYQLEMGIGEKESLNLSDNHLLASYLRRTDNYTTALYKCRPGT